MDNWIGDARRSYAERVGKFTQEDAAKFFGVSLSTYKKWEQGQGMMNGEQIRMIASKYDVTADYLLGIEPASPPARQEEQLTDRERQLVGLYRQMDAQYRAMLIKSAEAFVGASVKEDAVQRESVSA